MSHALPVQLFLQVHLQPVATLLVTDVARPLQSAATLQIFVHTGKPSNPSTHLPQPEPGSTLVAQCSHAAPAHPATQPHTHPEVPPVTFTACAPQLLSVQPVFTHVGYPAKPSAHVLQSVALL